MKFSAQEEYGLRCLLELAREPTGELTIQEIAERQGLTPAYVAKLMRVLRQGSLIKSTRGQKGGYRLAQPPEKLTISTVLTALGGRLYSGEFCGKYTGNEDVCCQSVDCSIRSLWVALDAVVEEALGKTTIQDMLCSELEMTSRVRYLQESRTGVQIYELAQ